MTDNSLGVDWNSFYGDVFGGKIGSVQGSDLFRLTPATPSPSAATAPSSTGGGINAWLGGLVDSLGKLTGADLAPAGKISTDPSVNAGPANAIMNALAGDEVAQQSGTDIFSGIEQWLNGLETWVGRGTIIILGFIFVAVGLYMFREPIVEAATGKV